MTILRIDARRLKDSASLHVVLAEAFGFPTSYGKNLDALVDCLTNLDNPKTALSRVQVLPGQTILLVLDHAEQLKKPQTEQVAALIDAVAFVNYRRLERSQPPVLALAYERVA